jgi:hypothetical protein
MKLGHIKIESIIPFFTKYPFPSVCLKATHFAIWAEIVEIMHSKEHLRALDKKLHVKKLILRLNKYKARSDN